MKTKEYTEWTRTTAIYKNSPLKYSHIHDIMYVAMGLSNEAGEVLGKVKKLYRDGTSKYDSAEFHVEISKEIGDVMWYVARLCDELNLDLEKILDNNVQKLVSRQERNVLGGSGDSR